MGGVEKGTQDEEANQSTANPDQTEDDEDSVLDTEEDRRKEGKCCPQVNRKLLLPKAFYFCFFSAWGSLLPYLALYFKQLLLTPSQVGVLMGLKPFVNFLATPVWGAIVDKFHIHRFALVVSMLALIVGTFAMCLVPGPSQTKVVIATHCNRTDLSDFMELTGQEIDKMVLDVGYISEDQQDYYFSKSRWPWPVDFITSLDIDPIHTKYKIDATRTFTMLFLITLFGTLIASPALALVDTATLHMLGKETHRYGRQRLTGSLGWGMGAFIVGASLRTTHRCSMDKNKEIVDYIPSFYVFAVLMSLGLIVSIKFKFRSRAKPGQKPASLAVGLQALKSPTYLMFLFTALYLGFLMAFIKTFLFWHLKDLGGTQLLFSVISAVNCVAEVSMYFLSEKLIKRIGQIRVLYLGLICYSIRLFYYSVIPYTWLVLAVELLPGITTAAVWAACLSYVSINSRPGAQTTMQCILHGVHWGLGYGAGEVIGGILVHHYGAPTTFVMFGILCIVVLLLYILINMIWGTKNKKSSIRDDETQTDLDIKNLPEEERIQIEKELEEKAKRRAEQNIVNETEIKNENEVEPQGNAEGPEGKDSETKTKDNANADNHDKNIEPETSDQQTNPEEIAVEQSSGKDDELSKEETKQEIQETETLQDTGETDKQLETEDKNIDSSSPSNEDQKS